MWLTIQTCKILIPGNISGGIEIVLCMKQYKTRFGIDWEKLYTAIMYVQIIKVTRKESECTHSSAEQI